jgi:hypothetical protein
LHLLTIVCIYRVSQEECAILRESVPYVILYWYNPKHLHPRCNGYWDNGQRKVWSSCGSRHCNWSADVFYRLSLGLHTVSRVETALWKVVVLRSQLLRQPHTLCLDVRLACAVSKRKIRWNMMTDTDVPSYCPFYSQLWLSRAWICCLRSFWLVLR